MKEYYKDYFPILNNLRVLRQKNQGGGSLVNNIRKIDNGKTLRTFCVFGILIVLSLIISGVSAFKEGRPKREVVRYVKHSLKEGGVSAKKFEVIANYQAYDPDANTDAEKNTMVGLRVLEQLVKQLENIDDEALAQMPQVIPHVEEGIAAVVRDSIVLSLSSELIEEMKSYFPGQENSFRRSARRIHLEIKKIENSLMPKPVSFFAVAYGRKNNQGDVVLDTAYVVRSRENGDFAFVEEPERWLPARH